MRYPLVFLTFIFCLGIVFASQIAIPWQLVYFLFFIFLFLCIFRRARGLIFNLSLCCTVFLLSIALFKNAQVLPKNHISNEAYSDNVCSIKGFVAGECALKNNKTAFIFYTQEIETDNTKHDCCGSLLVTLKDQRSFLYGDELIIVGNLRQPHEFNTTKQHGYTDYLRSQGIYCLMQAWSARATGKKHMPGVLLRFSAWSKRKMEALISKNLTLLPAAIVKAMILGEKKDIPGVVYKSMMKSGTVHILVVSGFNVGIVCFMVTLFLKLLRLRKNSRFYITIPLLIIYCFVTGASNPVVRATVMATVFMFGFFIKREPDIYNSLSIAVLFILGVNPVQLFDIGFQLSFMSVISIVYLYPKIRAFLRIDTLKNKYIRYILESCLVSFSAWVGTAGFIAYYFGNFSPITVIANLFIVPLATLITLCGFCLIIISVILPPAAPVFASVCALLVNILLNINTFLINLPGAYFSLSG